MHTMSATGATVVATAPERSEAYLGRTPPHSLDPCHATLTIGPTGRRQRCLQPGKINRCLAQLVELRADAGGIGGSRA